MRNRVILPLLIALLLAAAACGDDGGEDAGDEVDTDESTTTTATDDTSTDGDEPSADDTTTTEPTATTTEPGDDVTSTTGAPASGPTGVLADGDLTTAGGLAVEWSLTATADDLCFRAEPTHGDTEIQATLGTGPDDCVEPAGGIDDLGGEGLVADVGTVDGEKTVGYIWGRVAPEVIGLTIEHADGTTTDVPLLEGPGAAQLFVFVAEVDAIAEVAELEAVSGEQIEGNVAIRGFLRSGPTYPTVTPPPTAPPPTYPVS